MNSGGAFPQHHGISGITTKMKMTRTLTTAGWEGVGTLVRSVALIAATSLGIGDAQAHGFVGARFFPATLTTDDPFVADELSLPTFSTVRFSGEDGEPGGREYNVGVDLGKRITPNLAISLSGTFTSLDPDQGQAINGFHDAFTEAGRKRRELRMFHHAGQRSAEDLRG